MIDDGDRVPYSLPAFACTCPDSYLVCRGFCVGGQWVLDIDIPRIIYEPLKLSWIINLFDNNHAIYRFSNSSTCLCPRPPLLLCSSASRLRLMKPTGYVLSNWFVQRASIHFEGFSLIWFVKIMKEFEDNEKYEFVVIFVWFCSSCIVYIRNLMKKITLMEEKLCKYKEKCFRLKSHLNNKKYYLLKS